jgi:hypothetical protein
MIAPNREKLLAAAILTLVFVFVAALDIWQSSRFWMDLHDVAATFCPFIMLTTLALGAASVFVLDRRH